MTRAFVALGANLGDRLATLRAAVGELAALGDVTAVSTVYETEPVGFAEQPAYLNAVAALETSVPALDLLRALLAIERRQGRERSFANAPRTLDLDLLMYGDEELATPVLTLPHPRMHERAFVLVPLNEIAPDIVLQRTGTTPAMALEAIRCEGVRPFGAISP